MVLKHLGVRLGVHFILKSIQLYTLRQNKDYAVSMNTRG